MTRLQKQLRRTKILLVIQLAVIVPVLVLLLLSATTPLQTGVNPIVWAIVLLLSIAIADLLSIFRLIGSIKSPKKKAVYHRGWGMFLYCGYIGFVTAVVLFLVYGIYSEYTEGGSTPKYYPLLTLIFTWLFVVASTGIRLIIDQAILLRSHKYLLQQQKDDLVNNIGQE